MLQTFKNGQVSIVLRIKLLDSTKADGSGLTGLTNSSSGLVISTIADNESSSTAYTAASSTIDTISTLGTYAAPTTGHCGFKEVDATNHKGVYELQIADARFAVSNAKSLLVSLSGATNLAQTDFVVQLQNDDPYVAKPINYASLSIDGSGRVDLGKWLGTAVTLTGGLPDVNVKTIKDGIIAAATFAANALDAVWSTATRLLTAGTNIVLTKGTGLTGLNDLDAAGVRSAVGLASANLDTQLTTIDSDVNSRLAASSYTAPDNSGIAAIQAKTDNLPSDPADQSLIITATTAIYDRIGAPAGLSVSADLAAVKAVDDAVKAKTDNLPASPAATGDAMTLTAAYDAAKTAASQTSVDDLPTNAELAAALAAADDATLAAIATLPTAATVDAIKAKTDSLTFTAPGKVDANIKAVNDADVTGSGTSGAPWGPA